MLLSEFNFDLPEELIAQELVEPRDEARLLVLDRKTGKIDHKKFFEIADYLGPDDVLVFNNSKVFPARLFGEKQTGGKLEILLVSPDDKSIAVADWPAEWKAIGHPKPKTGSMIRFSADLSAEIIRSEKNESEFLLRFDHEGEELKKLIYIAGKMPLPPYIKNPTERSFREYQTVYAEKEGSVAAPTAGFHFTEDLMDRLRQKGVKMEFVSLEVGPGTFLPVKAENIEEHKMHSERYFISEKTADSLNQAYKEKRRIIAVGTTSCRVLESAVRQDGLIRSGAGETDIFIYPGYEFKFINGLITNFHLPKSTLLMLVSAFAGKENIFKAYKEAIQLEYKFYSFGDAMFIK